MTFEIWHLLRSRDDFVEGDLPISNFTEHFFGADHVSPSFYGFIVSLGPCENTDAHHVSSTGRQDASASNVLVTFGGVDVQSYQQFN